MSGAGHKPPGSSRRLDQWLWFARLVKTRSHGARLCSTGAVTLNGAMVRKANQIVRVGDVAAVAQGAYRRTVRVLELGTRRGPAKEARLLYQEVTPLTRLADVKASWEPLLVEVDPKS